MGIKLVGNAPLLREFRVAEMVEYGLCARGVVNRY